MATGRFLLLPVIIILSAASPQPTNLPVQVGGRAIREAEGAFSFGWPGTYFVARFSGPAVRVEFNAPREHMRLLIDGEEKAVIQEAGEVDLTVGALGAGPHVVRLEKMTESQSGGGRFFGFTLPRGGHPLPPAPSSRRIEFIGDSYTVGYGNRSTQRECTPEQVHDLTDTQQAFGSLLAKRLGADYRVNAFSGFGIVRNYGGGTPEQNLPTIYPRLTPDDRSVKHPARDTWQPHVIVINLGTNDFSTPLKPNERWPTVADLRSDYRERYHAFIEQLHATNPAAKFVLMGSDQFIDDVRQVAALARRPSGPAITTLRFGELDLKGCDWHPSSADHRKLADLLEKEVTGLKPW